MENLQMKKKPTISLSLFSVLSESFSSEKPPNSTKPPRNFEGGVVGLGIVAAMSDTHDAFLSTNKVVSPRSTPIPIVSSAKPAANFRGTTIKSQREEVDEYSEGYTCVISHLANNTIKKCIYLDDELNGVADYYSYSTGMVTNGVFSASPVNIGEDSTEFWTADFLKYCNLCKKQLHEVDLFIYRGERAFCSAECREIYIRNDDYKEKCRSGAMKPLDCSISPCSGPPVSVAGIVAA